MPLLDVTDDPASVSIDTDELHLVFDALDSLLNSQDLATRAWLSETYVTPDCYSVSLRQRTEALRTRIEACLN